MDNLSHSIVGLAAGELLQRSLAPEADPLNQHVRRRMLLLACWGASNFPDLDLVLTPLLPQPLGYLLHHRGHTHTLLFALPQALLLAALIWLLWPSARRLLAYSGNARTGLGLAIGLGFLLHLSMDYLNSYGIHPFYPFDKHWLFGDMIFILEPVFWVAAGVPLVTMVKRRSVRHGLLGLLGAALLWCVDAGFLHWSSLVLLALIGLAVGLVSGRARPEARRGLLAGLAACLSFVAIQNAGSARGLHTLDTELRKRDSAGELLDVSMTAYPANPLCWNFVAIERNEAAGVYRLRRGVLSLAPALMDVGQCPAGLTGNAQADPAFPGMALLSDDSVSLAPIPPARAGKLLLPRLAALRPRASAVGQHGLGHPLRHHAGAEFFHHRPGPLCRPQLSGPAAAVGISARRPAARPVALQRMPAAPISRRISAAASASAPTLAAQIATSQPRRLSHRRAFNGSPRLP